MNVQANLKRWIVIALSLIVVVVPFHSSNQSGVVIATDMNEKNEVIEEIQQQELQRLEIEIDELVEEIGLEELTEDATLEEKLDLVLADERLDGSVTGISVRNATNGEQIYEQFSDIHLRPASNMKLLTGAAALEVLGPDYTYTTEVLTDGKQRGKVLQGNLYIKGKGDPTLLKEDFVQFAKDLKEQGVKNIKGDLIGDATWYDDMFLSRDLTWTDEQYYYGAPVSALNMSPNDDYDVGTVLVEVEPGNKTGAEAKVSVYPENNHVKIVNKTKTVASGEKRTVTFERDHGSETIVVEGNIPSNSSKMREWRTVFNPTDYAISVFEHALKEEGIKLIGNGKVKSGKTPDSAEMLTSKESMPLKDIMIPFMKLSNNGHADLLVKEIGKVTLDEGSLSKGLEVVSSVLTDYGADTDNIQLRDGSGISDNTFIPVAELSSLLYRFQDAVWYPDYEESLPIAGESERFIGGTLRNRMLDDSTKGNVKGKTGSLTGVSALSGYVTTADGEELIFSFMMNNYISGSMTQIQDILATVLAEHEF